MKESGKFVLRISPELHIELKQEAADMGISLNQAVLNRITGEKNDLYIAIKQVFKKNLVGLVIYGSFVRRENRKSSDIDLLVILDRQTIIERSLYSIWEEKIAPHIDKRTSPQFVHLPSPEKDPSNLWLEVALEGEIVFDPEGTVRKTIYEFKKIIASGLKIRKLTYGQPYWITNKV